MSLLPVCVGGCSVVVMWIFILPPLVNLSLRFMLTLQLSWDPRRRQGTNFQEQPVLPGFHHDTARR